jgi:Ca-activated chloride channel homolog
MRRTLLILLCSVAVPALAAENVMLVLDASGSMWGQVDGKAKIEIARDAVDGLVAHWKPEDRLGLVAYGHRRKGDCADIETLFAPAPVDTAALRSRVRALNPMGMTPLSAAVIQAAEVLKSSEQKATVILISDGEETCNLDPCQVGKDLESKGVDFTAHVIGFDVADPAHQAQLRCLAENTGGQYFNARDAAGLAGSLSAAVAVSTEPRLPPASAQLSAPAQAPMVTRIEIGFEGPRDDGDYIAIYPSAEADAAELNYAWIKDASAEGSIGLDLPAQVGNYELRYVSPLRDQRILARRAIAVVASSVSVSGPAEAIVGSTIEITANGPIGNGHWVGFAPAGSDTGVYLDYVRPENGTSSYQLRTPVLPGDYELRYVLNETESVAARQAIKINAAQATIEAPAEVRVGELVRIRARGPVAQGNWIGFAPAGSGPGEYRGYDDISGADASYEIQAPDEAGDYELRFVLYTSDTVVATRTIKVLP